eukprot:jgi/Tetstr1/426454/TSEL_016755.t1
MVIRRFKTSGIHPAYDLTVNSGTAKLLAESLRREPRDELFTRTRIGRRVADVIADVGLPGVGVNAIRHSWITHLLRGNPSEANIRRTVAKFKHSPAMTTRYFWGARAPAEGED